MEGTGAGKKFLLSCRQFVNPFLTDVYTLCITCKPPASFQFLHRKYYGWIADQISRQSCCMGTKTCGCWGLIKIEGIDISIRLLTKVAHYINKKYALSWVEFIIIAFMSQDISYSRHLLKTLLYTSHHQAEPYILSHRCRLSLLARPSSRRRGYEPVVLMISYNVLSTVSSSTLCRLSRALLLQALNAAD